jgi:hypothetical protein
MVTIRYSTTGGLSGELVLDAAISQSHVLSVEVTKFPIEDGATISDHAIALPDTYQLEGLISNAPLLRPEDMPAAARRAENARDLLKALIAAREGVTIDTGSEVLSMMVLSGLTFPKEAAVGDCTKFSCTATQITAVRSETVPIPRSTKPGAAKGGRQPTQKASAPVEAKVSVLKQIVNKIRGVAPKGP